MVASDFFVVVTAVTVFVVIFFFFFPELVRVLLDLLKSSHQLPLAIAVLSEFKRTLSPANMEALWEWPWLEWLDTFLQDRG